MDAELATVAVYVADLDALSYDDSWALIAVDERERSDRFRAHTDRHRYVARRAFRRQVIGNHLGIEPEEIRFQTEDRGKPHVDGLEFNASSSEGLAVVAVGRLGPIGVDVELLGRSHDWALLERVMSPLERSLLESSQADRETFVLTTWTRKEAVSKAIGTGLDVTPSAFEGFSVVDAHIPDPRPESAGEWVITPLDLTEGSVAALATPAEVHLVRENSLL